MNENTKSPFSDPLSDSFRKTDSLDESVLPSDEGKRCAVVPNPAHVAAFWSVARKNVGWAGLEIILGQQQQAVVAPPWMQLSESRAEATHLADTMAKDGRGSFRVPLTEYSRGHEDLPKIGDLTIICDGEGEPKLLVRTINVELLESDGVLGEGGNEMPLYAENTLGVGKNTRIDKHEEKDVSCQVTMRGGAGTNGGRIVEEKFRALYPRVKK